MPRVAWKSFTEGRALARGLKLGGKKGWKVWSKSEQRPADIPTNPEKAYRDDGWVSWPDWLGSERVAWKSFTDGRAFARGLKLTGEPKWQAWSKSGQRPSDIPSNPQTTYRDDGWISWNDWLGNGEGASRVEELHGGAGARAGAEAEEPAGMEEVEQEWAAPFRHPGSPRDDVP